MPPTERGNGKHPWVKLVIWSISGVLAIISAVVAVTIIEMYPKLRNLDAEYNTSFVVGDLEKFVAANPGKWPKSWKDLGKGEDHSAVTRFRFDVTAEEVLEHPDLIYALVMPVSGVYYTYPHARTDLDAVLTVMRAGTNAPVEPVSTQ